MKEMLERVGRVTGARPITARRVEGGYTVASRWMVSLDTGNSVFVKGATDEDTARWLREEHFVYQSVRADFMPKLIGWGDAEYPMQTESAMSVDSVRGG